MTHSPKQRETYIRERVYGGEKPGQGQVPLLTQRNRLYISEGIEGESVSVEGEPHFSYVLEIVTVLEQKSLGLWV